MINLLETNSSVSVIINIAIATCVDEIFITLYMITVLLLLILCHQNLLINFKAILYSLWYTVEPLYYGHFGTRHFWPLFAAILYRGFPLSLRG